MSWHGSARKRARRGEIYRSLRSLRDRHGALDPRALPRSCHAWSPGFALGALLPENGFDVARALVGTEGTCVTILEATVRLVSSPPGRALLVLGFDDVFEAADRTPEIMTAGPIGLEGFDDRLVEACRRKGLNLAAIAGLPKGGGWLLVEFGGETAREAEAKAREAAERFGRGRWRVVVDPARQQAMWTLRESAVGATAVVPGKPSTYPGWEDSAVPPERLGRVPARAGRADRPLRLRTDLLRPLRRRLPAPAHRVRLPNARRSARLPLLRRAGGRPGRPARRLAFGRARRRPGSRRAAGADVRARTGRGVPRVQGDLGPGRTDEPGQGRRSAAAGRGPATGAARWPIRRRSSGSPRMAARWPGRWRGAWASASAAASPAERCAPRSRPRTRNATPPGAGRGCCGRCSKARRCRTCGAARRCARRWTCASPARAARATARSRWTSPRTRPSSWPTTTPTGCGRGRPTRWA